MLPLIYPYLILLSLTIFDLLSFSLPFLSVSHFFTLTLTFFLHPNHKITNICTYSLRDIKFPYFLYFSRLLFTTLSSLQLPGFFRSHFLLTHSQFGLKWDHTQQQTGKSLPFSSVFRTRNAHTWSTAGRHLLPPERRQPVPQANDVHNARATCSQQKNLGTTP